MPNNKKVRVRNQTANLIDEFVETLDMYVLWCEKSDAIWSQSFASRFPQKQWNELLPERLDMLRGTVGRWAERRLVDFAEARGKCREAMNGAMSFGRDVAQSLEDAGADSASVLQIMHYLDTGGEDNVRKEWAGVKVALQRVALRLRRLEGKLKRPEQPPADPASVPNEFGFTRGQRQVWKLLMEAKEPMTFDDFKRVGRTTVSGALKVFGKKYLIERFPGGGVMVAKQYRK